MNSLKWINKEIEKIIFKLIETVEKKEKFVNQCAWATVDFLNTEIKYLENERDTLYQIKSELEAWEVVKKCLTQTTQVIGKYHDKGVKISSWFYVEGTKEYETLKKALEVQNEKNN